MSLGFNNSSIIGGPFDPAVNKQLEVRKEILKNRNLRSDYDLQYLTHTGAWIRAISSVNDSEFDKDIRNQPATRYILQAGTGRAKYTEIANESTGETQLKFEGVGIRGGFEGVNGAQGISSYTTSELTGFTPMPGITGFSVKSKNTFGTLREATLEFTAHSIEDFNNLEKLFMRPGYTILVEWGHSQFIDNEKQLQTRVAKYSVRDFLNGQSPETIEKNLVELKKSNSGNYDGLYGFIKNFSWTYNGSSYICTLTIISKGELIESIAMDIPATGPGAPTTADDDESKKYNGRQISTDVHKFLFSIINAENKKYETISDGGVEASITNKAIEDYVYTWTEDLYTQVSKDILDTGINLRDSSTPIASQVIRYQISTDSTSTEQQWSRAITLRMLLSIINNTFLLKSEGGIPLFKFYLGAKEVKTPFYTFDEHIGLDPGICIIGRNSKSTQELMWAVSKQAELSVEAQRDILNIYIDATHIMDLLDSHVEKAGDKPPVLATFILDLLKSVQRNLGNINEFDIHHDESTSTLYIVDRKIVPDKVKSSIDLVGLNSEIENLNITSKLSSNIANMMAQAASDQTPAGLAGDMLNVQKWNEGLYDRHLKAVKVGNESKEYFIKSGETETTIFYRGVDRDGEQAIKIVRKDRSGFKFRQYISWVAGTSNYFIQYTQEDLKGYERSHIKEMRELGKLASSVEETNPSGLIPFELTFTMKGIGGLKIGQAFTIPYTFLPVRYKDRVGFLITGIDQRVSEGKWTTEIRTQMVVVVPFGKVVLPPSPEPESSRDQDIMPSNTGGLSPIKEIIAKYESRGDYGIANTGKAGVISTIKVDSVSIGELKSYWNLPKYSKSRVFAMGKYQVIPDTLSSLTRKVNLKDTDLFDPTNQEKIADEIFTGKTKRRKLGDYLSGRNKGTLIDLQAAIQDVGQEWASMPVIFDSSRKIVGDAATGKGKTAYYGGSAGNPSVSKVTVGTIANALVKSRINFTNSNPEYIPPYYT